MLSSVHRRKDQQIESCLSVRKLSKSGIGGSTAQEKMANEVGRLLALVFLFWLSALLFSSTRVLLWSNSLAASARRSIFGALGSGNWG